MTDQELSDLIMALQSSSPLRATVAEAEVIFGRMAALGYTISPPAAAAPAAPAKGRK